MYLRGGKGQKQGIKLWLTLLLIGGLSLSCRPSALPGILDSNPTGTLPSLPPSATFLPPTKTKARTPEPALSPTPVHLEGCVEVKALNVRSGPGTDFEIIGGLQDGDCVLVVGRNANAAWAVIAIEERTGWVSLEYLALQGDIQDVAVVNRGESQGSVFGLAATQTYFPEATPLTPTVFADPFHIRVSAAHAGPTYQSFPFEYACRQYVLDLPFFEKVMDSYAAEDRSYSYTGKLPDNWQEGYYKNFLREVEGDEMIARMIDELRNALEVEDDDSLVLALTSFVQNIEYDCDKLFSYENLEDHDYQTNFPYETLYDQKGVCGDTSILLGKMLQETGYGAAFLLYEQTNHMALGIRCPVETATYLHGGIGYCYIETTGPFRIGVKPSILGGEDFTESPQIVPIAEGRSFRKMIDLTETMETEVKVYGEYILQLAGCQEISTYKDIQNHEYKLNEYEEELDGLSTSLEEASNQLEAAVAEYESMGCEGTLPEDKYNQCVNAYDEVEALQTRYNDLVKEYNTLYEDYKRLYQRYVEDFQAFEDLMGEHQNSCSTVSRETVP